MSKNKNVEFTDSKKEKDELRGRSFKDYLNGSIITRDIVLKNIGFIIWLTFLGILYIGNSYHAETTARAISTLQRNVKDLRAESIITAADLMFVSRQSVVEQSVKKSGLELKASVEPPFKIEK